MTYAFYIFMRIIYIYIVLEVIEESRNELILQSLLNYRDLSLEKAMQSMSRLVASMLEDVMRALHENDLVTKDVIQRDDEVDRFYLLTVRQLKAAIEDPQLSEKIGIKYPRECLRYRLVTKSMERIGDHAELMAQNVIKLDHGIDGAILSFGWECMCTIFLRMRLDHLQKTM